MRDNRYIGIPFHVVLIPVYAWLLLYATNYDELPLEDVLMSGIAMASAAILLYLLAYLAVRNVYAAGIVSTLIIVCIIYYGHVFDAVYKLFDGKLGNKIFMPTWVGIFIVLIVLAYIYRSHLENLTKALNAGSFVLILMPLASVISSIASENHSDAIVEVTVKSDPALTYARMSDDSEYPDIYFLIFDRYADNRTLNGVYNYDNSEFLDHLRGRGFYIADQSRANYTKTGHSLASSLNLAHLSNLSNTIGPDSHDWKPVYELIQDNMVMHFLKKRGYRYIHLGSWWEPTRRNSFADENFEAIRAFQWTNITFNEFENLLVEPMLPIRVKNTVFAIKLVNGYDSRFEQFARVQQKFSKLSMVQRGNAPIYVFAHMLVPHPPFVFSQDGRYKTSEQSKSLTIEENYVDQLIYTNREIKKLVDKLLARERKPIIVIQADEGPFPTRYAVDEENFDWRQATGEELKQKFRILNAIYFPNEEYEELYKDITPVNTFRVIFNQYFAQELQLLPDKSYSFVSHADLYSFFDVTEITK